MAEDGTVAGGTVAAAGGDGVSCRVNQNRGSVFRIPSGVILRVMVVLLMAVPCL